jgi:hypothetical protein
MVHVAAAEAGRKRRNRKEVDVIWSRADADPIPNLSRMRKIMPFISPRRNESLVLHSTEILLNPAFAFLAEQNASRAEDRRLTLFHLYLRAAELAIRTRSGVNRFVAGGRLWQRNHVALTFSAKQEMLDGSPMITVKRIFPEHESLDEMVDAIRELLLERRRGRETRSDREMKYALQMPPFLIRLGVWALHRANMWGLLPRTMIDDDPLFTSLFIANLGSVGLEAGYHHLWEYGTCSLFGVVGAIKERADGEKYMIVNYSYDERIEDGLYAAISLDVIKESMENPEKLL